MYVRTTSRRRADGSQARYVQLAHNEWVDGRARARVLWNFGREDELDRAAVRRLIDALNRLLGPAEALAAQAGPELSFISSKSFGGCYVLDALWRRLGIDAQIRTLAAGRKLDVERLERTLFALVANRALEPCSKLAATAWVAERAWVPGVGAITDDACYRAMDVLLEMEAALAERVYWAVADLLNLEVDLLFFDTTSTYFEVDQPDDFRRKGHSKDHRPDLPQVIVGMAVTRAGIPIRVWCWPGNTNDSALIRQARDDLAAWRLARIIWVGDRGFASEANRHHLQLAGGHYILGEKLRSEEPDVQAALARQGRYQRVAGNLEVKEVVVDDATMRDRFVICRNPDAACRDRAVRDQILAQLTEAIAGSDRLGAGERDRLHGRLSAKPTYARYLRRTPGGLLRVDHAAVAADERHDGKFLLRCSDPTLSAADIAVGYKQLLEVERGWRDMKTVLELRPVHHRLEHRIRAHVVLCWLALLLVRIIETTTDTTWRRARAALDQLHMGTFAGPAGTVHQRTALTRAQQQLLSKLDMDEPSRFAGLHPAA